MTAPSLVAFFRRHEAGTRYDLTGWDGPGCPHALFGLLKRGHAPIVYLNRYRLRPGAAPDPRKPPIGIFKPDKGSTCISGVWEPDPAAPGCGFGDIGPRRDAILTVREETAGTLRIMVFPDLGMQAETLFLAWRDGWVSESILYVNKSHLDTDSVTGPLLCMTK